MNRLFARRPIIGVCLCCAALLVMLASPMYAASANRVTPTANSVSSALDQQVRGWVSLLAKKPPFAAWAGAAADIQALGPGTHGWYVLLTSKDKVVGYMVVHAAADGTFRLGEYGTGPSVLFSPAALKMTLIRNGLIAASGGTKYTSVRHYAHPLAAVWEVSIASDTYWIDGKTTEILPIDRVLWDKNFSAPGAIKLATYGHASQTGTSFMLKKQFDPYERLPWLSGEQPYPVHNVKKVQTRIRSSLHLRYVSEPFGDTALYALSVVGFQQWNGSRLDVALAMNGNRFIPLDTLRTYGQFYR